jgi:hypothetical protein
MCAVPGTRPALAFAALAAGLAGCASGPPVQVERRGDGPIAARVAAVYPYAFRWEEPATRSYQKAMDIVLALSAKGRLLVFGPDEFDLLRPADPDPSVGTDLVRILAVQGLDTRGYLVFRGWAERRIAQGMAVVEGRGPTRAASTQEVTYVAHLEVWDAARGRNILELTGTAQASPGADRPEYDPAPELTALNRRLVEEAWSILEPRLTAPPLREAPLAVRWVPAAAVDYAARGQASLRERMREMDPLEADVERLAVYRYFQPDAPPRLLHQDLRLPGGVAVARVYGDLQHFLREGDVITVVNGQMVLGPQVLQRALNLADPRTLQLKVQRGAARLELTITFP